jgi:hypothetical protein
MSMVCNVRPPKPPIAVGDDLVVRLGKETVQLTPTQGLGFAEQLARASFRRALTEEADRFGEPVH